MVAPSALYLLLVREHLRKEIEVAAQNVYDKPNGAFTGEISVEQLKSSGINWTLLGHSERRVILQEDDKVRDDHFPAPDKLGSDGIVYQGRREVLDALLTN